MLISSEKLFKIPVVSTDNQPVGRVVGLEIDIDSQSILQYKIAPNNIVARVLKGELLIVHRNQVVSISNDRMVIESGSIHEEEEEQKKISLQEFNRQANPAMNQDVE